ncbi:MAG: Zn-ribbon domain-containing OB-fold protein [Desulfomonilaceae bacterium]|nr:Zn-ribbon domain-containing OB-fold protein [Desulfomonilaceae bacterium]
MDTPKKPAPIVNDWARPFWEAARDNRLILQQCVDCGKHIFYPRIACPHCFSDNVEWVPASGKGTVYSYTVVETNAPSAFMNDVPYVVAVVKLDEGVQMLSNIVGCDPAEVRCDMPVEVTFEKLDDEFTLPKFRPS